MTALEKLIAFAVDKSVTIDATPIQAARAGNVDKIIMDMLKIQVQEDILATLLKGGATLTPVKPVILEHINAGIPDTIDMQARHDVNVTLNGAEVLSRIMPEIQGMVINEVGKQLGQRQGINRNSGMPNPSA